MKNGSGGVRVTILTIGSRGDVEPYLALGVGLRAAGHQIRLAAHACFEPLVGDRGLEFVTIAGDPRGTLEGQAGLKWLDTGKNPLTFISRMMDASKPFVRQVLDDYWVASHEADAATRSSWRPPPGAPGWRDYRHL
jgi:sterol 3beta-glucosyltransferase